MWGRIVSVAVLVAVVAGVAWALWPRPIEVDIAEIDRGDITVTVEEEGTARIREVFRVTAPVTGQLLRVEIHAGDEVTAGQTLATIEPATPGLLDERSRLIAEASVQAATAAVTLAEAALAQAEAQSAYASSESQRKSALAERGLVSTQVEEQSALAVATAQRSVDIARATLAIRRQDLASARASLGEGSGTSNGDCCAAVPSPITGEVLAVLTESAQVVQAGTPLFDLGDPTNLEIAVNVISADAVRLSEGASAVVTGWGGDPLQAVVDRVGRNAFTKQSALGIEEQRTEVVLRLLDPPTEWERLGNRYRVVAQITTWEGKNSVRVPVGALFRQGNDWAVFTVVEGKARLQRISIGHRSSTVAEVTDGLQLGTLVIVHPGDNVKDGASVKALPR